MRDFRALFLVFAAASLLASPPRVGAHGDPPPLEFYGNFESAATCQRLVSRAMRACFDRASKVVLRCAHAALAGMPCDPDEETRQLDRAAERARAVVQRGCTATEISIVGYTTLADAADDIARTCKDEAEALASLLYGPAMFTGSPAPGPTPRDRCLNTAARFAWRVARAAVRYRSRALDRIASQAMTPDEKRAALSAEEARVQRLEQAGMAAVERMCTREEFVGDYGMSPLDFFERLSARADCVVGASHVQSAITCPPPVCGNAVKERGEECDDGNRNDDACTAECRKTDCPTFANTFDLIQEAIFEKKGCTSFGCHDGVARQGGLDLTRGNSYQNLVGVPSQRNPEYPRVRIGDRDGSMLYLKLAAATLPGSVDPGLVGSPMPVGLPPLTADELEAVRLWIRDGAPRTGVVEGTGDLLDACLPEADPIQIEPPAPPPEGQGVQLRMPPNPLPPRSETEVCFASYYNVRDLVPAEALGPGICVGERIGRRCDVGDPGACGSEGRCVETFRVKKRTETQDPLSHHLIVNLYLGKYGLDHPSWGAWTCKGGRYDGQTCDPTDPASCGVEGVCGSEPKRSVACIGFGPPDFNQLTAPAIGGTQESVVSTNYPHGVYQELPVEGVVVWNSHAFNLTDRPAAVRAWMDLFFAGPDEQLYPVQGGLLEVDHIFDMSQGGGVPPFGTKEVCNTLTFPKGTRLFELSSHTHKRGKLFRYWNPQGELIYQSTQYNDPVQLVFDPPLALDSDDPADRTFRYCALYDNGATNPAEVKRRSTSPLPPPPAPPVPCHPTHCAEGRIGAPCGGPTDHATCDTEPGKGDGMCDACPLLGGFTTEDEMFLPIAFYYVVG
ncbi:MAG: hypothetical protein KatS3mg076_2867 [Candidatus Binatia bacterium]|nr:MAG: hypothetical protein KatS3mg076_2867 [Candidatus Binatia bacterium]